MRVGEGEKGEKKRLSASPLARGEVAECSEEMFSLSSTVQPQVSPASAPFFSPPQPAAACRLCLVDAVSLRDGWREVVNPKRVLGLRRDQGRESKGLMVKQRHDLRVMETLAYRVGCGVFAGESIRHCSVPDPLGWRKHFCPRCKGSK